MFLGCETCKHLTLKHQVKFCDKFRESMDGSYERFDDNAYYRCLEMNHTGHLTLIWLALENERSWK